MFNPHVHVPVVWACANACAYTFAGTCALYMVNLTPAHAHALLYPCMPLAPLCPPHVPLCSTCTPVFHMYPCVPLAALL